MINMLSIRYDSTRTANHPRTDRLLRRPARPLAGDHTACRDAMENGQDQDTRPSRGGNQGPRFWMAAMSGGYPSFERAVQGIRERVEIDANGCWIWPGSKLPKGYGTIGIKGRTRYTHRVIFESAHGQIPTGTQIDHLCRQPSCCNPEHLEAVTPAENTRRGLSSTLARARRGKKTHCPRGHVLAGDNLYVDARGYGSCKACRSLKHAEWAEKRRSNQRLTASLPQSGPSIGGESH